MNSRYIWHLHQIFKKVWVRAVSFALLAILSVGLARILSPYLPTDIALKADATVVANLLGILTSSMLAVTTFSLSIAVSAFAAASAAATPRVTVLLQEDRTTQNVLATFLGAFLFGLVGLIALHAKLYNASGRVVVFLFTVIVIGLVVVALIRWISHLMQFGRMTDTLDRVENAATKSLTERLQNPYLGGRRLTDTVPHNCTNILAAETGYVQHIDMQALNNCVKSIDKKAYIRCLPGAFVSRGEAIISVKATDIEDKKMNDIRQTVTIGPVRTFEEDPRFGLIVLTEVASKALSPAVNDPGTAINILGRLTRILSHWQERTDAEIEFPNIFVPPVMARDVIEDAFRPIGRDGASLIEVQIKLQKALVSLVKIAPESLSLAAERMSHEALERASISTLLSSEIAEIKYIAELIPKTISVTQSHHTTAPQMTPDPSREI